MPFSPSTAASPGPDTPFGAADLATCEHEQIHIPGSIQPHGALVVLGPTDRRVVQYSANAPAVLGLEETDLGGRSLQGLGDDGALASLVAEAVAAPPDEVRRGPVRLRGGRFFTASVHRTPRQGTAVELEPAAEPPPDRIPTLSAVLEHVSTAVTLEELCAGFAQLFRKASGYDRVMVYRFDMDGHGEVFAEDRRPDLESFLGNHYPASDIPQRARSLYVRNRVRILGDVDYREQPLVPRRSPVDGEELDMSMCALRSLSPIHLQYLRNMGVAATLVASIMVNGRLWGLVACHHYAPRLPATDLRGLADLLSEILGVRISALTSLTRIQAEFRVRALEERMARAVAEEGDWRRPLLAEPGHLLDPVAASGAALLCDGEVFTVGDVPGTRDLKRLVRRLEAAEVDDEPWASSRVAEVWPEFEAMVPDAAGVLAARLSGSAGDWLLWFRPERVRTVTWGGDPGDSITVADDLKSLSPRRSFAAWHQLVEGTSARWSDTDRAFGRMAATSVGDVLLQFRAVRALITRDQLSRVDEAVRGTVHPAVVVEPGGRISITSRGLQPIVGSGPWTGRPLEELAPRFVESDDFLVLCRRLLDEHRMCRSELSVKRGAGQPTPVFVRADPIAAAGGGILGFVLLFTDLADREAARAARDGFQRIVDSVRDPARPQRDRSDVERILERVLDNATFAAVELTEGVQPPEVSDAIRTLEASVRRSRRLLDEVVRQSARE